MTNVDNDKLFVEPIETLFDNVSSELYQRSSDFLSLQKNELALKDNQLMHAVYRPKVLGADHQNQLIYVLIAVGIKHPDTEVIMDLSPPAIFTIRYKDCLLQDPSKIFKSIDYAELVGNKPDIEPDVAYNTQYMEYIQKVIQEGILATINITNANVKAFQFIETDMCLPSTSKISPDGLGFFHTIWMDNQLVLGMDFFLPKRFLEDPASLSNEDVVDVPKRSIEKVMEESSLHTVTRSTKRYLN